MTATIVGPKKTREVILLPFTPWSASGCFLLLVDKHIRRHAKTL